MRRRCSASRRRRFPPRAVGAGLRSVSCLVRWPILPRIDFLDRADYITGIRNDQLLQNRAARYGGVAGGDALDGRIQQVKGFFCQNSGDPGDRFTLQVDFRVSQRHLPIVTLRRAA